MEQPRTPDPRTAPAWRRLTDAQKDGLLEIAGYIQNPVSLSRFDGSADFGVHPYDLSMPELHDTLRMRAIMAIDKLEVLPRGNAVTIYANLKKEFENDPDSADGRRYTTIKTLTEAALTEAKARLEIIQQPFVPTPLEDTPMHPTAALSLRHSNALASPHWTRLSDAQRAALTHAAMDMRDAALNGTNFGTADVLIAQAYRAAGYTGEADTGLMEQDRAAYFTHPDSEAGKRFFAVQELINAAGASLNASTHSSETFMNRVLMEQANRASAALGRAAWESVGAPRQHMLIEAAKKSSDALWSVALTIPVGDDIETRVPGTHALVADLVGETGTDRMQQLRTLAASYHEGREGKAILTHPGLSMHLDRLNAIVATAESSVGRTQGVGRS